MSSLSVSSQQQHVATTPCPTTHFTKRELMWPDCDVEPSSPYVQDEKSSSNNHQNQQHQPSKKVAFTTFQPQTSPILVDNVSGLQETHAAAIFFPMTNDDVRNVVLRAKRLGKKIAMRGTQHSMGKHNVANDAFIIDFKFMKTIQVGPDGGQTITCQPGATWADLIVALNPYARSPRTMQSYASFAVGGTLSVNAHGITTDYSVSESVLSIDVMNTNGDIITCSHDDPKDSKEYDLFRHVLGGYGQFGLIVSITMITTPNDALLSDTFMVPIQEFPAIYDQFLTEEIQKDIGMGGISVKVCRMNIITCETVQIFLFRRKGNVPTVGQLSEDNSTSPREMSPLNRLLYKWLLPPLNEVRFKIEEQKGTALDWDHARDKNTLLMEDATSLARILTPLFDADDTFILQEYFVPRDHFLNWIDATKNIFKEIFENETPKENCRVQLLNTTIRYVFQDTLTALPYSRVKDGTYAFVLYYRIVRSEESVQYLKTLHKRFVKATLDVGGTFYLPYLHHYSHEELLQAYPDFETFIKAKERLDPDCLFDSNWFREYGLRYTSPSYQSKFLSCAPDSKIDPPPLPIALPIPEVSQQRKNSLRTLMNNVTLRCAFFSEFMVNVFNVASSPKKAEAALSRCVWDPRNKDDIEVYKAFKALMDAETANPMGQVSKAWRQINQLSSQKKELTEETMRVLTRLGKVGGEIQDYVSIGDHGKLVRRLQRELKMYGKVYVLHEDEQLEDDPLVAVETGSSTPVGQFIQVDYANHKCLFPDVPSESADLITMKQGLHHLPQYYLKNFLQEVERILRPGGIFITREHDATEDLIPMVDAAHSVFNALTGVSVELEEREIRAFRPVSEWRRIITTVTGLRDSMIFEVQKGDPTVDIMLTFYKPPLHPFNAVVAASRKSNHQGTAAIDAVIRASHADPAMPFSQTIERLPETLMSFIRGLLSSIALTMEGAGDKIATAMAPDEFRPVVQAFARQYTVPIADAASKVLKQTEHTTCRKLQIEAFPSELYHGFFALENKVKKGKATPQEAMVVSTVRAAFNALTGGGDEEENNKNDTDLSGGNNNQLVDKSLEPIEMFHDEMVHTLENLLREFPQLTDPNYLLIAGFPEPIVDALHTALPHPIVSMTGDRVIVDKNLIIAAAMKFQTRLDSETWFEMKKHIAKIIEERTALTFDGLLGRNANSELSLQSRNANPRAAEEAVGGQVNTKSNGGFQRNPWHALFSTMLGSPLVKITYAMRVGARFYGVPELQQLYNTAQEMRFARRSRKATSSASAGTYGNDPTKHLPDLAAQELNRALEMLSSPLRHVGMVGDKIRNVYEINEVIRATYQGKDVTEIVKRKLVRRDAYTRIQFVKLEGENLDSVFNYGLTPLSHLFYGERSFHITYTTHQRVATENLQHASAMVKRSLRQSRYAAVRRVGSGVETANAMALHYYKLLEWMQVDICIAMSTSLNTSPWYRYPYMDTMGTYVVVLAEVAQVVFKQYGARAAFMSSGFTTAAVPGLLMAFFFAQMQLLAMPVRAVLGDAYDDQKIRSKVLVYNPEGEQTQFAWPVSFRNTGGKVTIAPIHGKQLSLITMPIFGEFTTFLSDLARHTHRSKATILDIDGNSDRIMIKTRMPHQAEKSNLQQVPVYPTIASSATPGGLFVSGETSSPSSAAAGAPPSALGSHPIAHVSGSAAAVASGFQSDHVNATVAHPGENAVGVSDKSKVSAAEQILRKNGFTQVTVISTYTATNDGVKGALPGQVYDFSAITVPVVELLDIIRCCDQNRVAIVQIFDFY